jgi:hypothetical protein
MRDVGALVVIMLLGSLEAAMFLCWDRRRLGAHGKARMWNDATLTLAIASPALGLGIPPFFAIGAHVWVTREGSTASRLAKGAFALVLAYVAYALLALGALELLGLPLDP